MTMERDCMKEHMKERFREMKVLDLNPQLPKCLNIELNNTCNHQCIFCPFHSPYLRRKFEASHMNLDFAKKILDMAKKQKIGENEIGFYATGEPLVYKELEQCIKYAKELGFKYTFITTNGALANPARIIDLLDAGLDSIRFSVNAATPNMYKEIHGKDDFSKVMENIRFLDKYRKKRNIQVSVSMSCVVTKKTKREVNIIKKLFDQLVDEFVFFPVMDLDTIDYKLESDYALDEVDENYEKKIKACPSLFNSMYINSKGQVRICCDARAIDIIAADLNQKMDLVAAWNSKKMIDYRKMHMEGSIKGSVCENCISTKKTIKNVILNDLDGY